ncbi:alpha/beta hydrolase family protein [Hyphococcus sp.]|uniref:alpha/beta hydrolase family protein n=1 Tax=Hyphococcus sp. TaxID=2038636 RepID=UPI003CCBAE59
MKQFAIILSVFFSASPALAQPTAGPGDVVPIGEDFAGMAPQSHAFEASDGETLMMDVYAPEGEGPYPAVVFVSGGADTREWAWFQQYGKLSAERGVIALVPTKRFKPTAEEIALGTQDTRDALKFARTLDLEISGVCLWVFSAGGSTMSALAGETAPADCAVAYYPVLDRTGSAEALSDVERDAWLAVNSPVHTFAQENEVLTAPILIVRAGKDSEGLNESIRAFTELALTRNMPLTLVNLPDAVHGFDGFDLTPWSADMIETSFDFVKKHASD